MRYFCYLRSLMIGIWIGILGPGLAFGANLTTPDAAVESYIAAIKSHDLDAVLAVTIADKMSEGFDFVANIARLEKLTPIDPAPNNHPFSIEINKILYASSIVMQVKTLMYGLMTPNDFLEGFVLDMAATAAASFVKDFRPERLEKLDIVKVGIPSPTLLNSEKAKVNAVKRAIIYGADASTERLALVSFEGQFFGVPFTLLRYGDEWSVWIQFSTYSGIPIGYPVRLTPEEFAIRTRNF